MAQTRFPQSPQSRLDSVIESIVNIAIGALVALLAQLLIFPRYGLHPTFGENLQITFWFTLVSFARSYLLRRYFNLHQYFLTRD